MKAFLSAIIVSILFSFASIAQTDSLFVITSDSVKLFVKRSGKGFPVLFIHGGPGSNTSYFEYEGGNVFEKDVQMIYLDQRGCGRSDTTKNKDFSLTRMVKDFEEVRKALGIKQWIIMPHSFGGIMATEYAYRHPASIKAMVYLNCTINLKASADAGIKKTIELLPNLKKNEVEYLLNENEPLINRWGNAFWHLGNNGKKYALMFDKPESFSLDSTIINEPGYKWQMGQHVLNFTEYFENYSPKTAVIKIPVLIISGTRDYTIGTDHYKLMQFTNKEVKHIAGGHALYLEHNAELYKAVQPFLKKFS